MDAAVRQYLSALGRRGGRKSRRHLSSEQARAMVRVRQARRAYQKYHTQCFWSFDPHYIITAQDVPWVAERLKMYGGVDGYRLGVQLCR